jgi:hypothetical protein
MNGDPVIGLTHDEALQRIVDAHPPGEPHRAWAVAERPHGVWFAVLMDERNGRAHVGPRFVVAPDGRILRFSGDPRVHDPDVIVAVLHDQHRARSLSCDQEQLVLEVERRTKNGLW